MMLRKSIHLVVLLSALMALAGCQRAQELKEEFFPHPTTRIILLDPSESITGEGWKKETEIVRDAVLNLTMRGDRIILIPVTRDGDAESSGQVLVLVRPLQREICDADIGVFQKRANAKLDVFLSDMNSNHGDRTDLVGAIGVAAEYFQSTPAEDRKELIVLSDFIQDANGLRFEHDARLADSVRAQDLARSMDRLMQPSFKGVSAFFGELPSSDLARLSPSRRMAIHAFWQEFMSAAQSPVVMRVDGLGTLRMRIQDYSSKKAQEPSACGERATNVAEERR